MSEPTKTLSARDCLPPRGLLLKRKKPQPTKKADRPTYASLDALQNSISCTMAGIAPRYQGEARFLQALKKQDIYIEQNLTRAEYEPYEHSHANRASRMMVLRAGLEAAALAEKNGTTFTQELRGMEIEETETKTHVKKLLADTEEIVTVEVESFKNGPVVEMPPATAAAISTYRALNRKKCRRLTEDQVTVNALAFQISLEEHDDARKRAQDPRDSQGDVKSYFGGPIGVDPDVLVNGKPYDFEAQRARQDARVAALDDWKGEGLRVCWPNRMPEPADG